MQLERPPIDVFEALFAEVESEQEDSEDDQMEDTPAGAEGPSKSDIVEEVRIYSFILDALLREYHLKNFME